MENEKEINACVTLKKLYDESENRVTTNAMVTRAYTDRISSETIKEKVDAQLNAIKIGIQDANPKFKEGSKNYEEIKKQVLEAMTNYEESLKELSDFYDGKIEQLILRKVELEAQLVGTLMNEQYLSVRFETKQEQKENDQVKNNVKSVLKKALEKITKKKQEKKQIDLKLIDQIQDSQDVEAEITQSLENRVEKTKQKQIDNKQDLEKIEKEIKLVDEEIKKINERKKQSLFDAMEIGNKALTSSIKRPKVFKRITRFFASRLNTAKYVKTTILEPFNERIETFRKSELSNIKG